jgi:hydrogenase assembly chaperone HypC/HupF
MCLSDVGRVVDVDVVHRAATVDVAGRTIGVSTVTLGLDAPPVAVGDWLIVHTGLAVGRLDDDEARAVLAARAELADPPERPGEGEPT